MSGAVNPAQYQGMPAALTQIVTPNGTLTSVWFRFFQSLWQRTTSGVASDVTLQGVADDVQVAQGTANNALDAVTAETQRATAAEANLQAQLSNLEGQQGSDVTNLQNQINSLQSQINTINQRLAAAGIP